jgi:hypothetical protein
MTATETVKTDARDIALRFVDAFNTRDADALARLVAEDAEFHTLAGDSLHGHEGLRTILETAEKRSLLLVPFRSPIVEQDGGHVRVIVPIRELIGPDDIERTAEFDVRDGRIAAFAIRPFE